MRLLCFLASFLFGLSLHAQMLSAPRLTEPYLPPPIARQAVNASPPLDNFDRDSVSRLYFDHYLAYANPDIEWTGNQRNCTPGTTGAAWKEAVLVRVNFFRAMAGLPSVTFNEEYNRKAQAAALMMSAQNNVTHTPDALWACYTSDGADAAGHSNLSLGINGPTAITAYVDDYGQGNYFVGHRRWILYPPQAEMGTGDIPRRETFREANCLWTIRGFGERPKSPEWVAWPPPGFVPKQVMPLISQRWSLSYHGADFSATTVAMRNLNTGEPMPIAYESQKNDQGYADNTIVWLPTTFIDYPTLTEDTRYQVTVSNVKVAGEMRSFSYVVTAYTPAIHLRVERKDNRLVFSMPEHEGPFRLEFRDTLGSSWLLVLNATALSDGTLSIPVPLSTRFFRAVID